jgi:hypothetical protein
MDRSRRTVLGGISVVGAGPAIERQCVMRPRSLKIGDRVRVVRLPPLWMTPGYRVPLSMRRVYKLMIDRRRPSGSIRLITGAPGYAFWCGTRVVASIITTSHWMTGVGSACGRAELRPHNQTLHSTGWAPHGTEMSTGITRMTNLPNPVTHSDFPGGTVTYNDFCVDPNRRWRDEIAVEWRENGEAGSLIPAIGGFPLSSAGGMSIGRTNWRPSRA